MGGEHSALDSAYEDWMRRNDDLLYVAALIHLARSGIALTSVFMLAR